MDERDQVDRHRYAKLVRAQLSTAELVLLFFNCLHDRGQGLQPLVEKYALFENMQRPAALDRYRYLYDDSAFEGGSRPN